MRIATVVALALLAMPGFAAAQGVTQSRDGLATASQGKESNNSAPNGSVNATTGPQAHPPYPSGSTTANPGAAFVRTMPKPALGPAASAPGIVGTTTVTGHAAVAQPSSPGVGQAAVPPK